MEVAQRLSKLCLSGEGDIGRRLHLITNFRLDHIQYPLDDFRYTIGNMAVDLRDGVRLTKLVEVLTSRSDYSPQLRWPAVGAVQRIHNLSVALRALQTEGVILSLPNGETVNASDIESGHREKTLFVVWALVSRWKLSRYLENIDIHNEIEYLKKILVLRGDKLLSVKVSRLK